MQALGFLALGYVFGSAPFGLLLTRLAGLGDIRGIGSGSIGATNVLRTGRKGLAAATLLLDGGKGVVAVALASWLGGTEAALWAGGGAVLGHAFPVWLGFKGGKSVATGLGVYLAVFWPVGVLCCAAWLVLAALFRISSVAGLGAFALAPVFAALFGYRDLALLGIGIGALVFARHHANIRRLLAGTEPRIGRAG
ncbi:MAG TPA: glycerol-3-phosphate 1-O-acyltransferase PlsY [Acetobacteraceae bacterium]|nr:glycerol-3-phosphate 1-O-acyltransferase PlsY [Acetobacteraceae bacterium]